MRGADGELLDPSKRHVPSQEDMLTSARVAQKGGQTGSFQQHTTISRWLD